MKNVHIFPNTTFFEPFVRFIDDNFDSKDHLFLSISEGVGAKNIVGDNIIELKKSFKDICRIIIEMNRADKVILHGLYSTHLIKLLFMQPWLLRKCYWVIWGGDLYYHEYRDNSCSSNINEFFRGAVIKRMGHMITYVKGDYELSKKWYKSKALLHESFMYPSNLYKEYGVDLNLNRDILTVQIGNSSDPSNEHIEVLEKLSKYASENIEIICPLSYGDDEYSEKVIVLGESIYGDKFKPIKKFLPFEEYLEILSKVDVAIFNHKRQQAMGNINTLLGLGKKVYIRQEITSWNFFKALNLKVFDSSDEFEDLFEYLDVEVAKQNGKIIKEIFSEKKLKQELEDIFSI